MNEHPLSDDLTKLSNEDLENRLIQLTQRWYAAKRMNMNQGILHQLDILLQGLEYEKQRRSQAQMDDRKVVIDTDGGYKN